MLNSIIIFNRVALVTYFVLLVPRAETHFTLRFLMCNTVHGSGVFRFSNQGSGPLSWAGDVRGALGQQLEV